MKVVIRISDDSIRLIKKLGYKNLDSNNIWDLFNEVGWLDANLGDKESRTEEEQEELDMVSTLMNEFQFVSDNDAKFDLDYINGELRKMNG